MFLHDIFSKKIKENDQRRLEQHLNKLSVTEGEVYDLEKEYGYEKPKTQPKRVSVPSIPRDPADDGYEGSRAERRLRADQERVKAAWAAHNAKKGVAEGNAKSAYQYHVVSKLDGNVLASYKTREEAQKNAHGNPVVSGSLETIGDCQYVREQGVAEGQEVDASVVIGKLYDIIDHTENEIKNADTDRQVKYATTVRDRAVTALNMIKTNPRAANAAWKYLQSGEQGVAEGEHEFKSINGPVSVKTEPGRTIVQRKHWDKTTSDGGASIDGKFNNPNTFGTRKLDYDSGDYSDDHDLDESEQQKGADYRDPKEADYGDKYQAMVKRVGQKAKAQELAKKQKQTANESIDDIIESRLMRMRKAGYDL